MLFCRFPTPEPSGPLANTAQTSILGNTGHAPLETPAASKLQTGSKHKHGNSKGKGKPSCSAAAARAGRGTGPSPGAPGEQPGNPGARSRRRLPRHADAPHPAGGGEEAGKQCFGEAAFRRVHGSCPASQPGRARTDSQAPAALRRSGGIKPGQGPAECFASRPPSDWASAGRDEFFDTAELCETLHGAGSPAAPARL